MMDHLRHPYTAQRPPHKIRDGVACHDAIVIFRKHLRFLQSFSAAGGTAVPQRQLGSLPIESFDNGFRLHGHFMNGAIAEVDYLFGMTQCETGAAPRMAGVRHARRKTLEQGGAEIFVIDSPRPASVSVRLELVVPGGAWSCHWQPKFHLYFGIGYRSNCGSDSAESRRLLPVDWCAKIAS